MVNVTCILGICVGAKTGIMEIHISCVWILKI